jgi:PAS domain S-box-containing protein
MSALNDMSIRRKLMLSIFLTSMVAMLLMRGTLLVMEFADFKKTTVRQLTMLGEVIATNSGAALDFDNSDDATQILRALKADSHITEAALYDRNGKIFATYPENQSAARLPPAPGADGYRFESWQLTGFQPVVMGDKRLGTLYLKYEASTVMSAWLSLSLRVAIGEIILIMVLTYALSSVLQRQISGPILALAGTARAVSERGDFSLRATQQGSDEVGRLTAAFNQMLTHIQARDALLSASEARFRHLVDGVKDYAVFMLNPEGQIMTWNAGAQRLKGYSTQEIVGRHISVFYEAADVALHKPDLALKTAAEAGRSEDEGWRVRKDGSRFWANVIIASMRNEAGELAGFASVTRDMTERKQIEAEILQMNAELEQRVIERTAQLEAASRAKSDFLAGMSHELRTPLNAIIGFSEVMVDGKTGALTPKQTQYLTHILNSGHHLLQLINNVLDLSKVEAGKMELYPEAFSARRAIEEVSSLVAPMAQKKNLAIHLQVDPALGEVTLDLQKFKQVLFNLISNAVKFTPDGGRIDIWAGPHNETWMKLRVRDTGIGIKAEDLDKLFKEFHQLDSGLARQYSGTGLGLALTKRIVEFQNGTIHVESEPGRGSTFIVVLTRNVARKTL